MKTILPAEITTVQQAKELLKAMHQNGEAFHPYDDAGDIIDGRGGLEYLFTKEEAEKLNKLMREIWELEGEDGFDACGYLLELSSLKMED